MLKGLSITAHDFSSPIWADFPFKYIKKNCVKNGLPPFQSPFAIYSYRRISGSSRVIPIMMQKTILEIGIEHFCK